MIGRKARFQNAGDLVEGWCMWIGHEIPGKIRFHSGNGKLKFKISDVARLQTKVQDVAFEVTEAQ